MLMVLLGSMDSLALYTSSLVLSLNVQSNKYPPLAIKQQFPPRLLLCPQSSSLEAENEDERGLPSLVAKIEDEGKSSEAGLSHSQVADSGNDSKIWTSEQADILAALFRTKPKPFSRDRVQPLPRKSMSKFRPVGLPKSRQLLKRPPAMARSSSSNPASVEWSPKDKRFLSHLAQQLHHLPSGDHVSCVLDNFAGVFRRGSLSDTIRELGRIGNACRASEVFLWQQPFLHLWPDDKTLHVTIEILAQAGMEEDACNLIHSFAPTSANAYGHLIRGFVAAHRLDRALHAKKEAESIGGLLDQGVYADLILLASRSNRKEVHMLVQELGKFPDLRLSLESCTSIMAACRNVGMHDAVQSLFHWWKSCGLRADVVMYEIALTSLARAGKYRDALAIHWEMEDNRCVPDLLVFTSLFKLCLEVRDCSKALRLFARMKEVQISATREIYIDLIRLCNMDGRQGKALMFLETMKGEGMPAVNLENMNDE